MFQILQQNTGLIVISSGCAFFLITSIVLFAKYKQQQSARKQLREQMDIAVNIASFKEAEENVLEKMNKTLSKLSDNLLKNSQIRLRVPALSHNYAFQSDKLLRITAFHTTVIWEKNGSLNMSEDEVSEFYRIVDAIKTAIRQRTQIYHKVLNSQENK